MALTLHPIRSLALLLMTATCLAASGHAQGITVSGAVQGIWTTAVSPVLASGDCTVADGASLTIMPGVRVLLAGGASLVVDGSLTALGKPDQPIEFAPSGSGAWRSIRVSSTGQAAFEQCLIHGGGASSPEENTGMLRVDGGWVSLAQSTLADSASSGVYLNNGYITVGNCHFDRNGGSQPTDAAIHVVSGLISIGRDSESNSITDCVFGVYNDDLTPVDATGTWWGAASGPQHITNVLGQGVSVSDDVIYNGFVTVNPNPTPGDLDRDGLVTLRDAAILLSIAGGQRAATGDDLAVGDLVPDQRLDLRDAQALVRRVAATPSP